MKVDLKYSTLITDNQWDQNNYNYPTVYLGSESRKDEVKKLYKIIDQGFRKYNVNFENFGKC